MKLELGKSYYNGLGEVRIVIKKAPFPDFDPGKYVFMDHMEWTYTEDGIYDEMDTFLGDIRYDLHQEVLE
jgi:hypothetical protein